MDFRHKLRVLLIEDEEAAALIAQSMLISSHCEVQIVKNGREATDELTQKKYDLVIMDWDMPVRNGQEIMKITDHLLNLDSESERVPLVLYTGTEASKIDVPHTSSFQLMDYWYKQDSLSDLNKRAQNLLYRLQRKAA